MTLRSRWGWALRGLRLVNFSRFTQKTLDDILFAAPNLQSLSITKQQDLVGLMVSGLPYFNFVKLKVLLFIG